MPNQCRICLENNMESSVVLTKIFGKKSILETLSGWTAIEVLDPDSLPKCICQCCFKKFESFYEFCQMIVESDVKLKEHLPVLNSEFDPQIDIKIEPDLENHENIVIVNDVKTKPHHEIDNELNNASAAEFKIKQEEETKKVIKRKTKTASETHKCKECNKVFKRSYDCRIHMEVHTGERKYACDFCPKKFARKYVLRYHRRTHTGEKPYTCEVCSKSFCSPSNYYVHKKVHTGEKKYKCNICPESFLKSEYLAVHIRTHTGERPFLCEICSSSFRSLSSLHTHKKAVHLQKEVCPVCHKMYSTKFLRAHLQRHKAKEEGIKRFICDQCGKKFTCSSGRRKHLLIHTGEKPFSCEICGKSFTQKSTLKTHTRVHTDDMSFPCDYCMKCFKYKHHLRNHIAAQHKDLTES